MLFHVLHAKKPELGRESMPSEIKANMLASLVKKSFKLGLSRDGEQSLKRSKSLAGPNEVPRDSIMGEVLTLPCESGMTAAHLMC